jgi:multiple sugar transport system substrate-binding protein
MDVKSRSLSGHLTRRQFLKGAASTLAVTALGVRGATAAAAATTAPQVAPTSAPAVSEPVHLALGNPGLDSDFVNQLCKEFSDQKKTITVEAQAIPFDEVVPKLTTAFNAGVAPDLMIMSTVWIAQFAAGGFLEDIGPRLKGSGLDQKILPGALRYGRVYKDIQYNLNYQLEVFPLYYNKQMLADAGFNNPPQDLDELAQMAKKLTDPAKNQYGFYMPGIGGWSYQYWSLWAFNYGGVGVDNSPFDADGRCIYNDPALVAGLQKYLDMFLKDNVSPGDSPTKTAGDLENAFNAGTIAMSMGWLESIATYRKGMGKDKFGVAWAPKGPAGQFVYSAADGVVMNSKTPDKDAAWEFMTWFMSPEINERVAENTGVLPSVIEDLSLPYWADDQYKVCTDMAFKGELLQRPNMLPEWGSFQDSKQPEELQAALLGKQTAQEMADHISEFLTAAMQKYMASLKS